MFLYAIKREILVNWAHVIMFHMVVHDEVCGGLAYVGMLTKIFKFFGVDLTSESCSLMNEHYEINVSIINQKMGVTYDKDAKKITYVSGRTFIRT